MVLLTKELKLNNDIDKRQYKHLYHPPHKPVDAHR